MAKFWTNTTLSPKRQHRWMLFIKDVPAYFIKKVDKPSITINETEHKFFGHSFFYPGHVTWETIDVTLVDPVDPDAAFTVMNAIKKAGYDIPLNLGKNNMPTTLSKDRAQKKLGGQLRIQQLNVDNQVIETWRLYNPFIKAVKFGSLDYSSDEMVEITVTFRFDYADYDGV
jgi:hypothetical protein